MSYYDTQFTEAMFEPRASYSYPSSSSGARRSNSTGADDSNRYYEYSEQEKIDLAERRNLSLFNTYTANNWGKIAAGRPDPMSLWRNIWNEGEICCLFADSNIGKSILAVQIANEIAERKKVIYFDFEMSDKQFQLRYTGPGGNFHRFSDNFLRTEIDPVRICPETFEEDIMVEIESLAASLDIKTVIIDNLTFLCSESERGDAASRLMMNLVRLKKKLGLSILVLAHTPKRLMSNPLTQNDLAGSKKLFNFFDSCFAIGKSAKDEQMRYIKQLKARSGSIQHGADNVIVMEIMKTGAWLFFEQIGYDHERYHLKDPKESDDVKLSNDVYALYKERLSQRTIASRLCISLSKVNRILAKRKELEGII